MDELLKSFMDVFLWGILAAIFVLIILHPKNFVTATGAVTGFITTEDKLFSGYGYQN